MFVIIPKNVMIYIKKLYYTMCFKADKGVKKQKGNKLCLKRKT